MMYSKSSPTPEFCIAGVGGWVAKLHLNAIRNLGGKILACLDPNDHNIFPLQEYCPTAPFFADEDKFLKFLQENRKENVPQYLSVCAPHDTHLRLCKAGLKAGWNVICEKPIVLSESDLDDLLNFKKNFDQEIYPVLQAREIENLIELKNQIKSNIQSGIFHNVDVNYITPRGVWYHSTWRGDVIRSGGLLYDIGIHFFDLMVWFFGEPIHIQTHFLKSDKAQGEILFSHGNIKWNLSIDQNDLPRGEPNEVRKMIINGAAVDFSAAFRDHHSSFYQSVIQKTAPTIFDAQKSIRLVAKISAPFRKSVQKPFASPIGDKEIENFENSFAEWLGVNHAVAVSSGTAALHCALASLLLSPTDEVIVPNLTYISTGMAVLLAGATPVFCDSGKNSFNVDFEQIKPLITSKTRAIIVAHLTGIPVDLGPIKSFCKQSGIALIEDVAQAQGSSYQGKFLGSFGTISCFSFESTKNMSLGEGGMIVTNSLEIAHRCRKFRNLFEGSDETYSKVFSHYRMSPVLAKLGTRVLANFSATITKRVGIGEKLSCLLPTYTNPPGSTVCSNSFFAKSSNVHQIVSKLRDKNIAAILPYPKLLSEQPVFEKFVSHQNYPNSRLVMNNSYGIMIEPDLTDFDLQQIILSNPTTLRSELPIDPQPPHEPQHSNDHQYPVQQFPDFD